MTRTLRFEWEIPDTVFDDQFPEEAFLTQLKVDAVCKLFTAGRLSSGYAASLLGITRRAFFDLLQQHHLPVIQYTEDDFAQISRPCARLGPHARTRQGRMYMPG